MGKAFVLIILFLLILATFPSSAQAMGDSKAQSGVAFVPPPPRMGQQLYEAIQKVADWLNRKDEAGPNVGIYPDDPKEVVLAFEHVRATDFPAVEEFARSTKSPWERQVAYYVLITQPLAGGDIELSMKYLDRLKKEFPSSLLLDSFQSNDIPLLEKTYAEYRQILSQNLPKDEELWRLANLFRKGLQLSFNVAASVYYILDYPEHLLEQILSNYPYSSRADDAAYTLIEWGDGRECCANLQLVPVYEAFINKYPTSDFAPQALLSIAAEYVTYAEMGDEIGGSPTESEEYESLDKAKSIALDVANSYKSELVQKGAQNIIKEADRLYREKGLHLILETEANTYILGEPIAVQMKIINVSPKPIVIHLDPTPPNFVLSVRTAADRPGLWLANANLETRPYAPVNRILIAAGGSYSEHAILQENCIHGPYPKPGEVRQMGAFRLSQEGNYKVFMSYHDSIYNQVFAADPVSITITSNPHP